MRTVRLSSLIIREGKFYISVMMTDSDSTTKYVYKERAVPAALALNWLGKEKVTTDVLVSRIK